MTKTKSLELTAQARQVDPRERMKEIRAEVKMYIEGGSNPWGISHLGELYSNQSESDDRTRMIIALQDMLEDERRRHNKATNHVAELVAITDEMTMQQMGWLQQLAANQIGNQQLRERNDRLEKENEILHQETKGVKRQLQSAMETLSLSIDMGKGRV